MKKIGMPEVSVRNKMKMDGIDQYWVRDFFGEPQPIVGGGGGKPMEPPCPKPDMKKLCIFCVCHILYELCLWIIFKSI